MNTIAVANRRRRLSVGRDNGDTRGCSRGVATPRNTPPRQAPRRWEYLLARSRPRRYSGLNQPGGISRDMGVQLPGHKPSLAHEDGDEFVRASAPLRLAEPLYGHHDDRMGLYFTIS